MKLDLRRRDGTGRLAAVRMQSVLLLRGAHFPPLRRSRYNRDMRLRFLKRSGITRDQAGEIARNLAETEGLPWQGTIVVHWGWLRYRVWANAEVRGGNPFVVIRRSDGKVLRFGITPR